MPKIKNRKIKYHNPVSLETSINPLKKLGKRISALDYFKNKFKKRKMTSKLKVIEKKPIKEDAPVNSAGGGNIAGIGIGPQGEPGRSSSKILRRKKFAGHEVFEVDTHYFMNARMGKNRYHRYDKYVGSDEIGEEIRQYGRKNPKKPIILQDCKSGAMTFLKY